MKKIWNNNKGFISPEAVILIFACLLTLTVSVYAFFTVTDVIESTGITASGSTCQVVSDPSIQQNVNIGTGSATIVTVREQLNDLTWNTIDSGNYSYAGNIVTINVTG